MFPEVKRLKREVDHLFAFGAEVKHEKSEGCGQKMKLPGASGTQFQVERNGQKSWRESVAFN
jgi:hypothetical protein